MKHINYNRVTKIGCCLVLLVYFGMICYVNFYGNATLYDTDMYSDMMYAVKVWEQKSLFPENWLFGNQLYVIATPVLAAIIYGLIHSPICAMGLASLLMGIGVILSLNWMLKPIFKDINSRLICCVTFMTMTLFSGGFRGVNGWQLFFTFCSYYACYAINCFMCFGCYLRSNHILKFPSIIIFGLSYLFSFATGIQSLRQTVIMILPLLLVEFVKIIYNIIHKNKILQNSLLITILFTVSNISGVLYSKINTVNQTQIFGEIKLVAFSDIVSNILNTFHNITELFNYYSLVLARTLVIIVVLVSILVVMHIIHNKNNKALICISLFICSIFCICLINILTTMNIRNIYYFMLFPLISILSSYIYSYEVKTIKNIIVAFLLILSSLLIVYNFTYQTDDHIKKDAEFKEIGEYLLDNDITTIYTCWGLADNIAIVSNFEIKAGFWDTKDKPFECAMYLCDSKVFMESPGQCAYVFRGKESVDIAKNVAEQNNLDFTFNKYFAEGDIYIYTSKDQILNILNQEKLADLL